MPDAPHKEILDREIFRIRISESFAPQLELLEQMVNYGTNLIPRCFDSSGKKWPDIVCIGSFFKHAVGALDAIHLLVREGSTTACEAHIRSVFEINLYLEWIFQADYEKRGVAYSVWNIRKKRYWNCCGIEGTAEHKAHQKHMQHLKTGGVSKRFSQEELKAAIEKNDECLRHPELADVNALFDKSKETMGREVDWYVPFGANNLREIAIKLKKEGQYKIFFSRLSEATHGKTLEHQLYYSLREGKIHFDHLRTLDRVDDVLRMTFPQAKNLFQKVIERYCKDEKDAFQRKFQNEWREAYRRIPRVSKQEGSYEVTPSEAPASEN